MGRCSTRSRTRSRARGLGAAALLSLATSGAGNAAAQPAASGAPATSATTAREAASSGASSAASAAPSTDEGTAVEQLLERAAEAEDAAEPARALALYRQAAALAPTSRLARRAERRIGWLEARREGDFVPLAALVRVRQVRVPTLAELGSFETEVDAFPPGLVRREARGFLADAYVRAGAHARARAAFDRWLAEPELEPSDRDRAARGRAIELDALGEDGLAALDESPLRGSPEARFLRLQRWLRAARIAAAAAGVVFVAMVVTFGLWRGATRRALLALATPTRAAIAAAVVLPPLLIVRAYDATYARAGVALAAASAVGLLAAALAGHAPALAAASRRRRALVAAVVLAAQLGLGFAALDTTGLLPELLAPWV